MVWESKHGQGKARADWVLNQSFGIFRLSPQGTSQVPR